ncbi:cytochrome P450 [Rhodococcus koreensis]|uniref:cytochrome P450 n=1 Tax=Rhodococcus koreensis TaxID=99653 RepID=UPI001F1289FB|nr:cytochrome P450 [Rhodococcus koreensis]
MTVISDKLRGADAAPTADWVTISDLHQDPFPIYRRMREESPIHWVPEVNRYMVTGYHACHIIENDQATFSADETDSLMKRAMGHSMLRKDDPEHDVDRRSYGGVLRPRAIKDTWNAIFLQNSEKYLSQLKAAGPGADLVWEYCAPYAAENLRQVMGFYNATQEDMQRWSQTMMDGTGNYANDSDVWARSDQSFDEVDDAIDEILPYLRKHPDSSLLSKMAELPIPMDAIRANMKMTIGGGLNEPRDVLGVAVWALLSRLDQLAQVLADPSSYSMVFDEAVRWVAPIGMYPRETTCATVLEGISLPKGARLGVAVGAANRDPAVFDDPEDYDINRAKQPHLAFGGGNHFCAGAWVARAAVAGIALPQLFEALPGLRLDENNPATAAGWVFRGMTSLPVRWGA